MADSINPAQPAESAALENELNEAKEALRLAQAELTRVRRDVEINSAMRDAQPADEELVRALLTAQLTDDADPKETLVEIRRNRPTLFRPPVRSRAGAMAPVDEIAESPVAGALRTASATGDRKALLHYLRIRRSA